MTERLNWSTDPRVGVDSSAPSVRCKICTAPSVYLCTTRNEHGPIVQIHNFRCEDCGAVFVGNQLHSADLEKAYATLDCSTYYQEIRSRNQDRLRFAAGTVSRLVGKGGKILDIGSGNGDFIGVLIREGYASLAAHEIPSVELSHLTRLGVTIYQDSDYNSIPSEAFE